MSHLYRSSTIRQYTKVRASLTQAIATLAHKPRVIVVTGPTAVGKSAVGLELARRLNGEVISADSVQVYQGLDIGSDKVTLDVRQQVPHHLIDIFPPTVDFNAGHFYELGRQAIDEILQRGKTPIVVGGTGFYLRWLVDGRPATPPSSPELEQQMQQRIEQTWAAAEAKSGRELSKEEKWTTAVDLLVQAGDPEAATRIEKETHNYYRLRRALQILAQASGKKLSDLDRKAEASPYDFRCFFLNRGRVALWERIMGRCEHMVEEGVLQEALWLEGQMADAGVAQCQAGKAIGYSEALGFLQSVREKGDVAEEDVQQLVLDIAADTRNLVRKQIHWFRKEPAYRWVNVEDGQAHAEVADAVMRHLELPVHEGGGGTEQDLSKEEARALKRVQHKLIRLQDPHLMAPVAEWVRVNVLGNAAPAEGPQ